METVSFNLNRTADAVNNRTRNRTPAGFIQEVYVRKPQD